MSLSRTRGLTELLLKDAVIQGEGKTYSPRRLLVRRWMFNTVCQMAKPALQRNLDGLPHPPLTLSPTVRHSSVWSTHTHKKDELWQQSSFITVAAHLRFCRLKTEKKGFSSHFISSFGLTSRVGTLIFKKSHISFNLSSVVCAAYSDWSGGVVTAKVPLSYWSTHTSLVPSEKASYCSALAYDTWSFFQHLSRIRSFPSSLSFCQ